jgi:hypothetical protein
MVFEAPEIEISSDKGDPSDIRNITGSVSLPTGAATAARQDTGNSSLASVDSKLNTLGQKTSALSVPVTMASNQPTFPVNAQVNTSNNYAPTTGAPYASTGLGLPFLDGDNQTIIRGDVLTDEGSFRDDFSGNSFGGSWTRQSTGNSSNGVALSIATLTSGTSSGNNVSIRRTGDYGPIVLQSSVSISQRIANQTLKFGLLDQFNNPNFGAEFNFTGTLNTAVTCISYSSSAAQDTETTSVVIPNGLTTASFLNYEINIQPDQVTFLINSVIVAVHKNHIPAPYDSLNTIFGITNLAAVTSTNMLIDWCYFINMNQLDIKNNFEASPIIVSSREDIHNLTSLLTTSATTADQVIAQTVIPANKTAYIVGYAISSSNIAATVVKIGVNTITPEVSNSLDGNIFRAFNVPALGFREADFSVARRIGKGGDTLKVTVTPSANTSTIWRVSLDYVLR